MQFEMSQYALEDYKTAMAYVAAFPFFFLVTIYVLASQMYARWF